MHPVPLFCVGPSLSLSLLCVVSLPGDIYVDTTNPDCASADGTLAAPFCTVTAAIAAASSGDTLHLAPGVYVENIVLGVPLTLVGTAGAAATILDGNGNGQVVVVQSTSTTLLDGLTIRNGRGVSSGGGVFNGGDLTLLDCVVTDNVVVPSGTSFGLTAGAGIFNEGNLTLDGTTVANNSALALPMPLVYSMVGAGMMSRSLATGTTTVLRNSTVRDNRQDASAGGYTYAWGAGVAIVSYVNYPNGGASLEMEGCTVRGNTSSPEVRSSTGAGVYLQASSAVLTSSTISGNISSTAYGTRAGGVASFQSAALPTTAALRNCTVSDNVGIGVFGFGDGVGPVALEHCTISGNTRRGIENYFYSSTTMQIGNSIVAENTYPTVLGDQDLSGNFHSLGHNLIGEIGASALGFIDGVVGDQVGTHAAPIDPLHLPLADNGGLTWTHALEPASPAIDAADPLSTALFDQRGVARPPGAADIGAFELATGAGLGVHVCDGVANSAGSGATLAMQGSAVLALNDVELRVAVLPLHSLGYFLTSRNVLTLVNPGGSQGNLCIASLQIGRYAGQVLDSGATGTVSMRVDLTAIPLVGAFVAAQVNETWYWQYWYRDMNPSSTSNFSAARGLMLQ